MSNQYGLADVDYEDLPYNSSPPQEAYIVFPDESGAVHGLTPGREYRYKHYETTDDELVTAMSITFIAPPSGSVVVSIAGSVRAL